MITGTQIRAARAILRWTANDLAKSAGITSRTVKRLEAENGVPSSTTKTLENVRVALESAGIEFIGTPDNRPGIRLARK